MVTGKKNTCCLKKSNWTAYGLWGWNQKTDGPFKDLPQHKRRQNDRNYGDGDNEREDQCDSHIKPQEDHTPPFTHPRKQYNIFLFLSIPLF